MATGQRKLAATIKGRQHADISTVGGHAGVMLTALLALFVLITVAWALHDSNSALERHKQFKHWDG
ncbi:MAG: hypothetical protein QOH34_1828 [Mycobacterium sp.]|nr:hypothetical protein [Mycobacterium sp.]